MKYLVPILSLVIAFNLSAQTSEQDLLQSFEFVVQLDPKDPFSEKELNDAGSKIEKYLAKDMLLVRARKCEDDECLGEIDLARNLRRLRFVRRVEENFEYHFNYVPNDPHFLNQWYLSSDPVTHYNIDAVGSWDFTQGSAAIKIGIIDSGVDVNHPELLQNLYLNHIEYAGSPGVDDDGNGYVDDIHGFNFAENNADLTDHKGHGTAVAGIIGGVSNNGVGISGINWYSNMVIAKVSDSKNKAKLSSIVEAFEYLRKQKVRIIQMALGNFENSWVLSNIIEEATKDGIMVVVGAGNNNINIDSRNYYPAKFYNDRIFVVCSLNNLGEKSNFSNFGLRNVDLCAPGENIVSTFPGGEYRTFSGTSMASAVVAGAAALVMADKPNLSADEVIDRLKAYSVKSQNLVEFTDTQGRLNIYNTLLGIETQAF